MRDVGRFRAAVGVHRRAIGRTQQELARAIGLHPNVLSHKLHARDGMTLTQADVTGIVTTLARWGALSTRAEARALLALMAMPQALPAAAWAAPPFDALALDAAPREPAPPPGAGSPAPPPADTGAALTPRALPEPLTPLIGRAVERAAVHAALDASRLVTLTGVGGTGKTRLAVRVARDARDAARFADGVAVVDLAPLREPALLALTIARALGLAEQPALPPEAHLIEALWGRHLLLVVDNMEHLLEEAPLLGRLLAAAPRLRILATSRVPLRLYGEHEIRVPPLPLPTPPGAAGGPRDLGGSEAVRLFVARARAVAPGFAPTGATLAAVAAICAALDGLPLAIELAAARVKLFAPEALLPRLGARLDLLTDGPHDQPARHQTMRAALDWSYALLTPAERTLFAGLGVFAGPFDATAAAAVCAPAGAGDDAGAPAGPWEPDTPAGPWEPDTPAGPWEPDTGASAGDAGVDLMLGRLAALADQSLLEVAPGPTPRFRLLETVRAYALARLAEAGAVEAIQGRRLRYYLTLAEAAAAALRGPRQGAWLAWLEREHDNLRAALSWAREQGTAVEGLRLAGALWRFWAMRGHVREGQGWLEAALGRPDVAPDPAARAARARALGGAGRLAWQQGDYARATARHGEALALWRHLGDTRGSAAALTGLGNVASRQGDEARAVALHTESLVLKRALGDRGGGGIAISLGNLGRLALQQGDDARATVLLEESLTLHRQCGDTWGSAAALTSLGRLALQQGDHARATVLLEESLALKRALGDPQGCTTALSQLGRVALLQGDGARAAALLGESLRLGHAIGARDRVAEVLESLAAVAAAGGQPGDAARLGGAATALREALSLPLIREQQASHAQMVRAARAALGADAFAGAWAEGMAWEPQQAVTAALALAPAEVARAGS